MDNLSTLEYHCLRLTILMEQASHLPLLETTVATFGEVGAEEEAVGEVVEEGVGITM